MHPIKAGRATSWTLLATLACVLAACQTASFYAADADHEVGRILEQTTADELGGRQEWVLEPEPEKDPDRPLPAAGTPAQADPAPGQEVLTLDLKTSLEIAVTTSREYLDRKESVYLRGLDLSQQRYNFGPIYDGTVSYLWSDEKNGSFSNTEAIDLGVSKILDQGGTLELASVFSTTRTEGSDRNYASDVNLVFVQPLMRGYGYEVSHEPLTQSQRNMVYEVRDFELFREDFTIGIAEDFLDLVSRKQTLQNRRLDNQQAAFDAEKAEALRQLDRNRDEDVFNARRRAIDTQNALLVAQTDYDRVVDSFKIRLGLPVSTRVVIADVEPPFEPVRLDEDSAVATALHNRLDLITERGRVEDAERLVRIARDGLRPDLDLATSVGYDGSGDNPSDAVPDDWKASAGLTLELPLDRQAERNAYRAALIDRDRARRDYSLLEDQIERDIRDQLRQLQQVEQRIQLQRQQIQQELRAVAVTEIRFEAGDPDTESRDLTEARQSLLDARNALIRLTADHFVRRLRLMRNLGILFIEDNGMWRV